MSDPRWVRAEGSGKRLLVENHAGRRMICGAATETERVGGRVRVALWRVGKVEGEGSGGDAKP